MEENKKMTDEEALELIAGQVEEFKKYLNDDAVKKQDLESVKALVTELKANLDEWNQKQISEAIDKINKKNESLHKQIIELQEKEADRMKGEGKSKQGEIVSEKEIRDFVSKMFPNGEKDGSASASIELKAAETFGGAVTFVSGSDATAATGRYVDPTLYQKRRKSNLILDYFNIQTINVPSLIYLEKVEIGSGTAPDNGPGGADWINCGESKPGRSFRIDTNTVEAKKLAIFGNIEDCLLMDVPSFERWIREDFTAEMREKYNEGLLFGNPAVNSKEPEGLVNNAKAFVVTDAYDETVVAPNYIDAIFAASATMASNKETPALAVVSTDVYYALHSLKSSDGKWLNNNLVYINNLGQLFIGGVLVVPSDDIASANLLLIGADPGFKIYNYGNLVFESGLNGSDFREDKTSYRAWQRVISFIPQDREWSVIYDTFDNILSAIEAPAEVVE